MDKDLGNVNFSGVLKAGLILLVIAAVVHVLMWLMFGVMQKREARVDPKPPPMFQKDQRPPKPILQINPTQDYKQLRTAEDQLLNSYGWVDKDQGIVRIPISEAMKKVVEQENSSQEAQQ